MNEIIERLKDSKCYVWWDDDAYSIGFNDAIDLAISILTESPCAECQEFSCDGCKYGEVKHDTRNL